MPRDRFRPRMIALSSRVSPTKKMCTFSSSLRKRECGPSKSGLLFWPLFLCPHKDLTVEREIYFRRLKNWLCSVSRFGIGGDVFCCENYFANCRRSRNRSWKWRSSQITHWLYRSTKTFHWNREWRSSRGKIGRLVFSHFPRRQFATAVILHKNHRNFREEKKEWGRKAAFKFVNKKEENSSSLFVFKPCRYNSRLVHRRKDVLRKGSNPWKYCRKSVTSSEHDGTYSTSSWCPKLSLHVRMKSTSEWRLP